jgi:hypothetical protein
VTTSVAAAEPNKRTVAKTNASETDIRARTDGNLMLKEPVSNVKADRTNQPESKGREMIS